jgi:hypothetical protein
MSLANSMNLRRLYAIRLFLTYCILPDGYHFPSALDSAIRLTEAGEGVFWRLSKDKPTLSAADAKAAIMAEFVSGGDFFDR